MQTGGTFLQLHDQSITTAVPRRKAIRFTGRDLHIGDFNVGADRQAMAKYGQHRSVNIDLTLPVNPLILQDKTLIDLHFVQAIACCEADHAFVNSAGDAEDAVGTLQPLSPCRLGVGKSEGRDLIVVNRQD